MKPTPLTAITLLALAVAGVSQVQAAIVYSGPNQNVTYSQYDNNGTFSLFNDPANWDDVTLTLDSWEIPNFENRFAFLTLLEVHGNYVDFALDSNTSYARNLTAGSLIDATLSFSNNDYINFSRYQQYLDPDFSFTDTDGEFYNSTGYAGLRFTKGLDIFYGWMQIQVTNSDNNAIQGVLIDWAYQDSPGIGIQAGAVAIPEPSTYGIILGGLVLAGAAVRRRKRSSAA
jgi:hypothetical protein